jgi:hypothetical protein
MFATVLLERRSTPWVCSKVSAEGLSLSRVGTFLRVQHKHKVGCSKHSDAPYHKEQQALSTSTCCLTALADSVQPLQGCHDQQGVMCLEGIALNAPHVAFSGQLPKLLSAQLPAAELVQVHTS